MGERVLNLSERPRETVVIKVGGKDFRIRTVVNAVWLHYMAVDKEQKEWMQRAKELAASGTSADLVEAQGMLEQAADFGRRRLDLLLRCVELLLTANGYDFDRQWWIEHTEMLDLLAFIEGSVNKDTAGQKKTDEGDALTGGASPSTSAGAGPG